MKTKRHAKILEIVRSRAVNTQEELLELLRQEGFSVTQATVSRDIKELRLVKALDADGVYRYAAAKAEADTDTMSGQFYTLFSDAVRGIDYAGNLVVVRCLPGMAQAVCASMDSISWKNIVGTLAGEDTFICIMKTEDQAIGLVAELKKLTRR